MSNARLWGWLSPDAADPLAGAPLAEALLASTLELPRLERTPPVPLELASVPQGRLTAEQHAALVDALGADAVGLAPETRVARSMGQSYPDQLARRAGRCPHPVDAVAFPASHTQAQAAIDCACAGGFRIMPVGGATSVVGGLAPAADPRPIVAVDLSRMHAISRVDPVDMTATAEVGIRLVDLEAQLEGLTLGHFPQSYLGASLGGSIAANGAGQRSDGYGRLADRLLRARFATPSGEWHTEPLRHSAAGPWLGGLATGSEGLFGILTHATLALSPKPQRIVDLGWLFPSFEQATHAARTVAQERVGASMVRISDEAETRFLSAFRLARAGRTRPGLAEALVLAVKRAPPQPSLLLAGFEGTFHDARDVLARLHRVMKTHGGIGLGERPGKSWRRSRFEAPHLREALMARGLGIDTFETAAPWSKASSLHASLSTALSTAIAATTGGTAGLVMCHASHSYVDGVCLYFTTVFPRADDPLEQWRHIKTTAMQAIVDAGGTVSHHHGLGADHAPWAAAEKGPAGMRLLGAIARELDPGGVMATGLGVVLER